MSAGLASGRTKRVVHKFATGQPIPDAAVYLNTVRQTSFESVIPGPGAGTPRTEWKPCWLVWHYFLVEVPA